MRVNNLRYNWKNLTAKLHLWRKSHISADHAPRLKWLTPGRNTRTIARNPQGSGVKGQGSALREFDIQVLGVWGGNSRCHLRILVLGGGNKLWQQPDWFFWRLAALLARYPDLCRDGYARRSRLEAPTLNIQHRRKGEMRGWTGCRLALTLQAMADRLWVSQTRVWTHCPGRLGCLGCPPGAAPHSPTPPVPNGVKTAKGSNWTWPAS